MSDVPTQSSSKRFLPRLGKKSEKVPGDLPRWSKECLCGQTLSGYRSETPQRQICENCDRRHFILPVSPYPLPRRLKRKKKKAKEAREPFKKKMSRFSRSVMTASSVGLHAAVRNSRFHLRRMWQSFRQSLTPLRLTLIVFVWVIIGASFIAYRQYRYQNAVSTLRDSVAAAEEAVENENWAGATESYRAAASAIAVLGRDDEFARAVMQKNREFQAIAELCPLTISDIVEEASDPHKTTSEWKRLFEFQIADQWIISETWLPRTSPSGTSLIDRIPLEEEPAEIHWPASLVSPLPGDSPQVHVLLAGQIAGVRESDGPIGGWIVEIRPETAFRWCFPETLTPLNFELDSPWMPDDSLRSVLERQRSLLSQESP